MIYVFLANGFEEMEALTPVDVLRRCELEVVTVGVGGTAVRGSHGIMVAADISEQALVLDERVSMIILPGGMPGTLNLERSAAVQKAVDYCVDKGIYIAAICAAPSILGNKGLLAGKNATCFPGFEVKLTGAKLSAQPVVVDGTIITAKGAGVALPFSLKLVEILCGKERAAVLEASLQCK